MNYVLKSISIVFLLFISCSFGESAENIMRSANKLSPIDTVFAKPKEIKYSWLSTSDYDHNLAIINQIGLPAGYTRTNVAKGSFAEWLRFLPLKSVNSKVLLFDGREKPYQKGAYRVINIDVGHSDLQQCADAIMRLKAEYHYSRGEYDKIHFNFTSGHKVSFEDWRKGRKPKISGNSVNFSAIGTQSDNSYSNFKKYLNTVFSYAGTASLEKELLLTNTKEIKAGDLFIKGGFPGHAVIVLDVAENLKSGDKIFLLAQSYMPAQSIHILKNFDHNTSLSPWYPINLGEQLHTPEWDFDIKSLKKWK
jgi:hypothetical protein